MSFINTNNTNQNSITGKPEIRTSLLENEMKLSAKLFNEQNTLDERITNNMLKINVVIYLFTLCLITLLVFFSSNIFCIKNDDEDVRLNFSLLRFSQEGLNGTFPYDCIYDYSNCDNNCKNISIVNLRDELQFECLWFQTFAVAGIIVNS